MTTPEVIVEALSRVGTPLCKEAATEIERLRAALEFVANITAEELDYVKVGTGAEVALYHG